jgi:hypothetical protein
LSGSWALVEKVADCWIHSVWNLLGLLASVQCKYERTTNVLDRILRRQIRWLGHVYESPSCSALQPLAASLFQERFERSSGAASCLCARVKSPEIAVLYAAAGSGYGIGDRFARCDSVGRIPRCGTGDRFARCSVGRIPHCGTGERFARCSVDRTQGCGLAWHGRARQCAAISGDTRVRSDTAAARCDEGAQPWGGSSSCLPRCNSTRSENECCHQAGAAVTLPAMPTTSSRGQQQPNRLPFSPACVP